MSNNLSKTGLRKALQNQIKYMLDSDSDYNYQITYSTKILNILYSFTPYLQSKVVLAYYPIAYEPSCLAILNHALDSNKSIFLPKIYNDKMKFYKCATLDTNDAFQKNYYGIYEPTNNNKSRLFNLTSIEDSSPMIVFVPALAYTKQGHRLGRGKAYYDRFLSELLNARTNKCSIILIGLCFSFQIIEYIPTENHDISVDYLLCEKGLHKCTEPYGLHT